MTVTAIDRRFRSFRVMPETEALDYANDVLALSQEGRVHLARAYDAHAVEEAPALTEGQLDLALCPEGLAGPGGHAA